MKIFIGGDHQGSTLVNEIYERLLEDKIEVEKSSLPNNPLDDYPDFSFDVCKKVIETKDSLGIVLCGNGIGVSIASNKVKNIRCARVVNEEDAHHAKKHNGANVIALGVIDVEEALRIIKTFIKTDNPTEERHLRRIEKIINYENGVYNGL